MNERSLDVLNQYDLNVEKTVRGREAYIVWANKGCYLLFEYSGTDTRLSFEAELLDYIMDSGFGNVDTIVRNKEGELCSKDDLLGKFVLKKWYDGRECDVKKTADIISGVQGLAYLHLGTEKVKKATLRELAPGENGLDDEYDKHNRELKRVRNYIRGRKRKNQFEYDVLAHFDEYYEYAKIASEKLKSSEYCQMRKEAEEKCSITHGMYNYHNILMNGNKLAIVNFNHSTKGVQIRDLYFFLRKIMEKHDWNVELGKQILDKYSVIKPISDKEINILKIMLLYPEKFWKVLNQYNNSNKSWISDKSVEKLLAVYRQQELKKEFVDKLWN